MGQQWQMILRGDRVLEFLSLAADHVACNLRVLIPTSTLEPHIMVWGGRAPEPTWLSRAARGTVSCLADLKALLSELHTARLCTGLTHPSQKEALKQMDVQGKLPEGIQHVKDRGGVDMFLDERCTVLSDCMSMRAAHQCPCCSKLAGTVNQWSSRLAARRRKDRGENLQSRDMNFSELRQAHEVRQGQRAVALVSQWLGSLRELL